MRGRHEYFESLEDPGVLFRLSKFNKICMPAREDLELILIGAKALVAYSVHPCSRILGDSISVLGAVLYIPRIDVREIDS